MKKLIKSNDLGRSFVSSQYTFIICIMFVKLYFFKNGWFVMLVNIRLNKKKPTSSFQFDMTGVQCIQVLAKKLEYFGKLL